MWKSTTIIGVLVTSSQAMVNYGDMVARRTITAGPEPTDVSIAELGKRSDNAALEGYTSEFGTCK
jgi:hypothetical protein